MRDAEVGKRKEREGRRGESARGPEMAALNPARSKTGFARHTKAPPRDEGSRKKGKKKKKRARKREREHFHHRSSSYRSLVGK